MRDRDELLSGILQAANKHPNSRVSKLIRIVEEERTQKNIVLLLIELAENAEYATDFGISLKYYLDLFEEIGIGRDIMLSEAGLLLLSSSKIYSRRVDYVQELVEAQILTLCNADREITDANNEQKSIQLPVEKVRKGRKRILELQSNAHEIELVSKKIRKLGAEKRFPIANKTTNLSNMKMTAHRNIDTEQYIHPAGWVHANIVDLENEEEIDSKRNYRLFTYHVEHRYNTLVPDINFRLHFKVKDYIEEQEERHVEDDFRENSDNVTVQSASMVMTRSIWPPLSEEYVARYLNLENEILGQEVLLPASKRLKINHFVEREKASKECVLNENENTCLNDTVDAEAGTNDDNTIALDEVQNLNATTETAIECSYSIVNETLATTTTENDITNNTSNLSNTRLVDAKAAASDSTLEMSTIDSALGESITESEQTPNNTECLNSTTYNSMLEKSVNDALPQNDSALGQSISDVNISTIEVNNTQNESSTAVECASESNYNDCGQLEGEQSKDKAQTDVTLTVDIGDKGDVNLGKIRVHLPHLDDEGVFFSDLDEQEQRMLSPTVVAFDVFPSIPNKKNITIIVDEEIKGMLNMMYEERETFTLPGAHTEIQTPIVFNILKIHEKFLRRRILFKLGPEMDLYLRARSHKRTRPSNEVTDVRQTKIVKFTALNNINMGGVYETPPMSPSQYSEFYGFSDAENSQDFVGFTEEEQNADETDKNHRLSRDSGVGVETPITPSTTGNMDTIIEEPNFFVSTENKEAKTSDEPYDENSEKVAADCDDVSVTNDTAETDPSNAINTGFSDTLAELEASSRKTKIQKWHEHLQPILAKSRERHHFDVFQIGTEIIDELKMRNDVDNDNAENRKGITFQDVMDNKNETYVSRYFLSSLLLANQSNIKITINNKSSEEPSAWSDIHFELLSTKRHTVSIEDNIGMIATKARPSSSSTSPTQKASNIKNHTDNCSTTTSSQDIILVGRETLNVNLSSVKPLKSIEKLPQNGDDYDSAQKFKNMSLSRYLHT